MNFMISTSANLHSTTVGTTVTLTGWIQSIRDHGKIVFLDLRDRAALVQIVCDSSIVLHNDLKTESVIEVTGVIKMRSHDTINPSLNTGYIEVCAYTMIVHNLCYPLPFPITEKKTIKVDEDLRLEYRYLDLRRPIMLFFLKQRSKAAKIIRYYLSSNGFLEIETPLLFKRTPEGAREFLVSSILNPGYFYALSQSPQQYKQMLMVSGVERYYSMARCLRDENLRSDRQLEFTQVDIEMSFVDREDIYGLVESLLDHLWSNLLGIKISIPFTRITYNEAMERYGSDKPDTRFPIELNDLSKVFKNTKFQVFKNALSKGWKIKAVNAKSLGDITPDEIKLLKETAKSIGVEGLTYIKVRGEDWLSPILKYFSENELEKIKISLKVEDNDLILLVAANWSLACNTLGRIRLAVIEMLIKRGILNIATDQYNFLWVVDFPLVLFDNMQKRYVAFHHPFTAPISEDIEKLATDPKVVRSQAYDIVLNGVEIGGGSIRIHNPKLQKIIFDNVLCMKPEAVKVHFGYMLKALKYGAPPHGGIALGFDRICAILCHTKNIRDVIAFPKTNKGQDLMVGSPSKF